ncbi:hypothetical protein [uncultured Enterococcus sp.]|uniref:hypothetical protein n=1 Tax=uncultured Enterococcus sp. TaxID=167972 RepID=UPI002AA6F015|nr:hypothetical protein [uncultured Enterococcus sp.]
MTIQLNLFLALLLLAYPLFALPGILRSKKEKGKYFSDPRFLIPKYQGNGNSLNMHNVFGFALTLILGLTFLLTSLITLF